MREVTGVDLPVHRNSSGGTSPLAVRGWNPDSFVALNDQQLAAAENIFNDFPPH